ncbi:Translocator protein-like [Spatholobus suberectus]|nr:Translocator protein-like [Spatholobus suberectus]
MASNDLKHRVTAEPDTAAAMNDKKKRGEGKRDRRMVMAKRGLRSLAIAVCVPLSLAVLSACIGSSSARDAVTSRRPFWFPPSWALHLTCPASSFLMGLAAWMVWADGGFHRNPMALSLYLAQLLFTVLWDPIVFAAGATRVGLIVCVGLFVSQIGCMRVFRPVNPIAAELIKPCLAWVAFLSIVNLKLLFV